MKKNVVQDVVPPKRSIRNVTLSSRETMNMRNSERQAPPRREPSRHQEEDDDFTRPVSIKQAPLRIERAESITPLPPVTPPIIPSYKYDYEQPKKPSKKWVYVAGAVFALALAFGVSAFFKSAVIRVTPKQQNVILDSTFKAVKDSTGTSLGFQVVTVSKDVERTVPATGEQQVEKKAQGRIVIYNDTALAQKLIATTRFQTPEGLIYRLPLAVTVPAKQTKDGKSIAGSVEVNVEADKAGANYNIGLKDFTLPGLKGDPKFTQIYARSKTEMTGGFSGIQKGVSKDDLANAETELSTLLKDSLSKEIVNQIPENFILYDQSLTYTLSAIEQVEGSASGAILKKRGTTSAVIFDKNALTAAILAKVASNINPAEVKITNLSELEFNFTTPDTFNPNTDTNLNFNLKGSPVLVWIFDENKLKADLLGLSRVKAKSVLSSYTTIQEAWVETHPFWNQTIPANADKVTLVNTLTK